MKKVQDEEIIERIKKKDYAGLEELLAVYGDSMLRTIHSVLSQPHEVSERQDVANEVFYEVWQNIAAYQPERSRLITWLLLISRSRAIDHKRKLNKRSLEEKPVDEQELAIEESPLTKENFLCFIEDLEALDQRIFLLYYFYQESPETIAEQTDLNVSAIYNRLSRGRKRLKERMTIDGF
ncbi:sigma-70 family RNA polymerase sigma factor [Enterococcus casseliflavus]|uniref:sigma-70 family RNA polymerase sigma factor n=1 Tax=Enterococcus casseliflavus TaxID=37734 RepID=UPI000EB014D7|nr:sigma-70 family RNA polymerase sigma factor [Enterococcus casseliflavus]AYJ45841.1 sigma-70 family RNA polymerase sigma factor [Enterococcus casseliflavus]MBS5814712.1 sigma-70 family RNA polymerase sigma factor [Enterococcus casseliflavus]MCD4963160.1 sigma-70 family RNA polymerase sigma factor [Enterococcus casseliflavus]MDU3374873.1 sigma-70 family RNA polymerase sigma factor [Enterococcus casseliflavus]